MWAIDQLDNNDYTKKGYLQNSYISVLHLNAINLVPLLQMHMLIGADIRWESSGIATKRI